MYCDLYLPFPTSTPGAGPSTGPASKKGKGKAAAAPVQPASRDCWDGLAQREKEDADKVFAVAGHCELAIMTYILRPRLFTLMVLADSGIYNCSQLDTLDKNDGSTAKPFLRTGSLSPARPPPFGNDDRFKTTCSVVQADYHSG